jgi:hypothetical protein
VGNHNEATDW